MEIRGSLRVELGVRGVIYSLVIRHSEWNRPKLWKDKVILPHIREYYIGIWGWRITLSRWVK